MLLKEFCYILNNIHFVFIISRIGCVWNDFHNKIWMGLMCTGVVYTIELMIITTPLLLCCGWSECLQEGVKKNP